MSFIDKAKFYVEEMNWPVLPVGKHKKPLIDNGCYGASSNPEKIIEWNDKFPDANIALATGKASGITVVDIDGKDGEESLSRLIRLLLWKEPDCPQVLTGKGRHLYFKCDCVGNSVSGSLGKGIDVRGNGGSATLPPSEHESGVLYEWVDRPNSIRIPLLPLSIIRLLNDRENWYLHPERGMQKRSQYRSTERPPPDIHRIIEMVSRARKGWRNHTLNKAAFLAGKAIDAGVISQSSAIQHLTNAALAIGLTKWETRATILSGLRGHKNAGRR